MLKADLQVRWGGAAAAALLVLAIVLYVWLRRRRAQDVLPLQVARQQRALPGPRLRCKEQPCCCGHCVLTCAPKDTCPSCLLALQSLSGGCRQDARCTPPPAACVLGKLSPECVQGGGAKAGSHVGRAAAGTLFEPSAALHTFDLAGL